MTYDPDYREKMENRRARVIEQYRAGVIGEQTLRVCLGHTGLRGDELDAAMIDATQAKVLAFDRTNKPGGGSTHGPGHLKPASNAAR